MKEEDAVHCTHAYIYSKMQQILFTGLKKCDCEPTKSLIALNWIHRKCEMLFDVTDRYMYKINNIYHEKQMTEALNLF